MPTTPSALSVGVVWARHQQLDGQIIRVSGIVYRCHRLDCQLAEAPGRRAKSLGIGSSPTFDRAIQPYLGHRIIVEARLKARCLHISADRPSDRHGDDIVVCTDRADELADPKIVAVT